MRALRPAAAALLLAACSMNPELTLPTAPVPDRFAGAVEDGTTNAASLGWRAMFADPRLERLIELALTTNRDLRVTTANVEAARAQFRIQRASQLPSLDATASDARQRQPPDSGVATTGEFSQYSASIALTAFEIDLFGRQRSLSQAAFERYLATEEGRRAARITLIGAVVDGYLNQKLAEEQKRLTERTLADWRSSLDLTHRLHDAHQNSGLDLAQAEGLVQQAEADLARRDRAVAQAANAMELLVGSPIPADLPPASDLMAMPILTELAAGLPSDLLVRRPDIRQAEHELRAANADIGAARAAFFPRLSLTAALGVSSLSLDSLFTGASRAWSITPQIVQPIFHGGRLQGELDLSRIRKSTAIAQYERAIQSAFREVADGLAGRATYARQVRAQGAAAATATRRVHLSTLRYRAGLDNRLELLDAQRSEYAARQALLDLKRDEFSSAAGLYRALGGGD